VGVTIRGAALVVGVLMALPAFAREARFFRTQSQSDFLAGTLDGIAVDPLGNLGLADRVERVADLGEPFLFSAAVHPEGWVVGTGNGGKVLLVGRNGAVKMLFAAPEPEVFAVWSDPDGTVFAGTSPEGRVYRLAGDESAVFFEPEETYIWALGRSDDGDLLVATGTEGRLYRVDSRGVGEVVFDSEDTHLRSMKVLESGAILLGTAGEGLILRLDPDGGVRTLHDAVEPEVVAFAEGPTGSCYAALLASEASLIDLAGGPEASVGQQEPSHGGEKPGAEATAVTVAAEGTPAITGSRPAGFRGPRSEVLRIAPSGVVESLWRFEEETVYALRWHRQRLWVGTGLEGKLYSFQDRKMVLEKDVDERQIVAILGDDPGPAFATTNAAAISRASGETERSGSYTSPALDAGQVAHFGNLRWLGGLPGRSRVRFSARSGMSAQPDLTWSDWTVLATGQELELSGVPASRYLQWRVELEAADHVSPEITEVVISYVQENLAPRVKSLSVLDPGEIIVPANFNPGSQVFEPIHPSRDGIFTTLEPSPPEGERRRKTLWKKGFRTLTWEAEDPNEDELIYELMFRREEPQTEWLPMQADLEGDFYSFDATALADGTYRFLLKVFDRRGAGLDAGLGVEEISEPVVIDHAPPVLESAASKEGRIELTVRDALSPLRQASISVDAGEWRSAVPEDGLLDGRREKLSLEAPEGARLLLLQVMDSAFNLVTFDLSRELP
jgi:hypothetical protein